MASQALADTNRFNQRDCPVKALLVVWLVVCMAIYRKLSIKNVFLKLVALAQENEPGLSARPVTPEAVIHAKARLGCAPLKHLFRNHVESLRSPIPSLGFNIWAVDGVELTVPDTPGNEACFGRRKSRKGSVSYPSLRMMSLIDTSTHVFHDVELSNLDTQERNLFWELLNRSRLGARDLVLMDRGISAFWVFAALMDRDIGFLARINDRFKFETVKKLGVGDELADLSTCFVRNRYLSRRGLEQRSAIRVRILTFRVGGGELVRLATTLLDPDKYPAERVARLYHKRWEIEIAYDELKTHLFGPGRGKQLTNFRSKTPEGIEQEAYGMLVAFNLIRETMLEAALRHEIPPLEISFTDTLVTIQNWSWRLQGQFTNELWVAFLRAVAAGRLCRPRRPRQYPRRVKKQSVETIVKKPGDKELPLDLTLTFEDST